MLDIRPEISEKSIYEYSGLSFIPGERKIIAGSNERILIPTAGLILERLIKAPEEAVRYGDFISQLRELGICETEQLKRYTYSFVGKYLRSLYNRSGIEDVAFPTIIVDRSGKKANWGLKLTNQLDWRKPISLLS